jgi:hypothetical protein
VYRRWQHFAIWRLSTQKNMLMSFVQQRFCELPESAAVAVAVHNCAVAAACTGL